MTWQKGQSGNPNGGMARKVSPNASLRKLLKAKVDLDTYEGQKKRVRQLDKLMQSIIDDAINGDETCRKWIWDRLDGPIEQNVKVNHAHEHTGAISIDWDTINRNLAQPDDAPLKLAEHNGEYTLEGPDEVPEDTGPPQTRSNGTGGP